MISVYTGHCRLGKHAKRLVLIASDECRFCNDLACGKDMVHLLNECPALDRVRHYNLGRSIVNVEDFGQLSINDIKSFLGKCRGLEGIFPF